MSTRRPATGHRHPVNRKLYDEAPLGSRVADRVTNFMGSWTFIVIQTIVVAIWVAGNAYLVLFHFDPYPFIFLNLAFSTQAAYAAPLILLAETRQAERDKFSGETIEKRHDEMERRAAERVAALKAETDKLEQLLTSNTDLTRQDKELTEQVAALTREIHAALTKPS